MKNNSPLMAKKNHAQGSLETLLLVGGAVLVAAIVLVVIIGSSEPAVTTVQEGTTSLDTSGSALQQQLIKTRTKTNLDEETPPDGGTDPGTDPAGDGGTDSSGNTVEEVDVSFFLNFIPATADSSGPPSWEIPENTSFNGALDFSATAGASAIQNLSLHLVIPSCITSVTSNDFTVTSTASGTDLLWESPSYNSEVNISFNALANTPGTCEVFAEYAFTALLVSGDILITEGGALPLQISPA